MTASEPRSARRIPTSALMVSAAFGAIQSIVFAAVVPLTTVLAVGAPPAYAAVAAVHSVMPLLARLVTGIPGMATVTALVTALLTAALSPIGFLAGIPMLVAGLVLDVVLPWHRSTRPRTGRVVLAGAVVGVVLFFVALPVFSPEHLVPSVLIATLLCRVGGQVVAALLVLRVAATLRRHGVIR